MTTNEPKILSYSFADLRQMAQSDPDELHREYAQAELDRRDVEGIADREIYELEDDKKDLESEVSSLERKLEDSDEENTALERRIDELEEQLKNKA